MMRSTLIPLLCQTSIISLGVLSMTTLFANPVLDHVTYGDVVVQQEANTTTITQTSKEAVIDWKNFNINANETTHFNQPAGGMALNRISAADGASAIYGKLTATGQIILVNPAGIFFGPSASIDVGGLVATSDELTNKDFLNHHYHLTDHITETGSIVNESTVIAPLIVN